MTGIVESIPYTGYGVDASGYLTGINGLKFPELWLGTSGSEVKLTADIATLNNIGALSSRVVPATAATLAITQALHDGKTIYQNAASGCAISLPTATGSGMATRIFVATTITSVGVIITATGTDNFVGSVLAMETASNAIFNNLTASNTNTVTLNGTTTGGIKGSYVMVRDVAANVWALEGVVTGSGTLATSFSHV